MTRGAPSLLWGLRGAQLDVGREMIGGAQKSLLDVLELL